MGDPEAMLGKVGGGVTLGCPQCTVKMALKRFLGSLGDFELFHCPL